MDLASEKGASNWHTILPLTEHSFTLHREAFHNGMTLYYGWPPPKLPYKCDCGNGMSAEHALSKGDFPIISNKEIHDLTANLLTKVCNDICTEPELQPVLPQQLMGTTIKHPRWSKAANSVWGKGLRYLAST